MYPVLQLGPLSLQTPGLALLLGVWLALDLFSKEATRQGDSADHAYNAGFYALLGGLAAARLGFVILHLSAYLRSPLAVVSITPGSTLPGVGLVVAALVWAGFLYRKRALSWRMADALAPGLAVMTAAVALANLLSGDGYGLASDVPWAIELWSARRHPTQLYELSAALAILGVLWRRRGRWPFAGAAFLAWVVGYGGARLFLEAFRADSWVIWGDVRGVQVVALLAVITALGWIARRAPAAAG